MSMERNTQEGSEREEIRSVSPYLAFIYSDRLRYIRPWMTYI